MTIFSEDATTMIRSALANAMNGVDVNIPIDNDHTVHITSERGKPVNREWQIVVKITTSIIPEDEESPFTYLHEVDESGVEVVEAWEELVAPFPWLSDHSWNFMVDTVYSSGGEGKMAMYKERVRVNAEDVLTTLKTDQRLVRVSYTVPREMYVVVDADVDLDSPGDVTNAVPNLGWESFPVVDLEPEMVKVSLNPHNSPHIPSVGMDEVEDVSVDVVESEYSED